MKRLVSAVMLFVFVIAMQSSINSVFAVEQTEESISEYRYCITPDSDDWGLYSVAEKVEMLQIPDSELAVMSNESLIVALAAYPYLVDIYLYGGSVYEGVQVVRTYCSALNELLERDPTLAILNEYLTVNSETSIVSTNEENQDAFAYMALSDILSAVSESYDVSPAISFSVKTPN